MKNGRGMLLSFASACVTGLALGSASAAAADGPWSQGVDNLKSVEAKPTVIAVASVNVRVGTTLEKLTLLSGEGHTGKKVAAGGLALLSTLAGVGGVNFAEREPLEEHLDPADASKIAAEIVESLEAHFHPAGVTVIPASKVAEAPFYVQVSGLTAPKQEHEYSRGRMFHPEMYLGLYEVPAGPLKFRERKMIEISDKELSPQSREALGAQGTLRVDITLVNDRKQFRVREVTMSLYAPMKSGISGDQIVFQRRLEDPDHYAVPSGGKETYTYWQALRPQFEALVDDFSSSIGGALDIPPAAPAVGAPVAPSVAPSEPATPSTQ